MKKILFASAAAVFMAGPAFAADNDSVDVIINATVPEECSIEDINPINLGEIDIVTSAGANALQIEGRTQQDANLVWVSCNFTNQMTLETPTPLESASTAGLGAMTGSQPFTNQINYRFRAQNFGNSPEARSLDQRILVGRAEKPVHKQIRFRAIVDPADNVGIRPYAATDYTAIATVSITTL